MEWTRLFFAGAGTAPLALLTLALTPAMLDTDTVAYALPSPAPSSVKAGVWLVIVTRYDLRFEKESARR